MPRDDAEFAAWLAARWPSLVRVPSLLGSPMSEAVEVATAGAARCRPGWTRLREEGDVDVEVHAAVLEEWHRRRREERDPDREAAVLTAVTDLDEHQVAEVLGVPVTTVQDRVVAASRAGASETRLREDAREVEVPPPPYDAVDELVRQSRRRRRRLTAAVTAAVLVLGGAATWASTRSSDPPPDGPLPVVVARNVAGIAWYAADRLHLREVTVEISDLTDLAAVGDSVAYLDRDGRVGLVDARGVRTVLGSGIPGSRVLGSGEDGWVAWLESDDSVASGVQLVVWSVAADELLASAPVAADTTLVAIDQHQVYLQGPTGFSTWEAAQPGAQPELAGLEQLAGVASAVRVFQRGQRIEMVQPFFSVEFVATGEGASVSPGGSFVISREPAPWEPGSPFTPLVYNTRSGDRLPSGTAADEQVVDAAFAELGVVTYFVVNVADLQGATLDGETGTLLVLRRCDLESGRCSDLLPVRGGPERAMFAD